MIQIHCRDSFKEVGELQGIWNSGRICFKKVGELEVARKVGAVEGSYSY